MMNEKPQMHQNDILIALNKIFRSELDDSIIVLKSSDSTESIDGWDSLAHVRIVASVEAEFDFQFEVSEIEEVVTVEALISAIRKHKALP